jgi:hypothetical protein
MYITTCGLRRFFHDQPELARAHLQDGAMFRPFAEIVNTVFPPGSRPEVPVTPARTAIWPPVGKVGLPASVSMTASVAVL